MKLGYARVSTEDQTLDLQRPRLLAVGCEKLFEEKISGAKRNRPELEKLLGEVRKKVFWSSPVSTGWRARPSSFSP